MHAEDCLFFRKVAFPRGRDPVDSHCLQENALKTAARSERCAENTVRTEEESPANMKKKKKLQKEK